MPHLRVDGTWSHDKTPIGDGEATIEPAGPRRWDELTDTEKVIWLTCPLPEYILIGAKDRDDLIGCISGRVNDLGCPEYGENP